MNHNYEERREKRFHYEAAIWHQYLLPGRFYKAAICNLSRNGLYFESDQSLYRGEKIQICSQSPGSIKNISDTCTGVEIFAMKKHVKQSG